MGVFCAEYKTIQIANDTSYNYNSFFHNTERIKNLILLSDSYFNANSTKADSIIREAIDSISEYNIANDTLLADCYHIIGKILIKKGKYNDGIDTLKSSLYIKQNNNASYKSIAKTLNYIGVGYLKKKYYDSAEEYFTKSLSTLIPNNIYDINAYYSYSNYAILFADQGKYNAAANYFDSSVYVIEKTDKPFDSITTAFSYNNLALFTTITGKLDEANSYFDKAEQIFEKKLGVENIYIADLNNNKGVNSYYNNNLSKAKLYYKKALNIYLANSDKTDNIPTVYYNLSQINNKTNDIKSSINYCIKGLEYSPDHDMQLLLNKSLAESYSILNDSTSAFIYYKRAINLLNNVDINPKRYYEIYLSFADFLATTNNPERAQAYYQKAIDNTIFVFDNISEQTALALIKYGDYCRNIENNQNKAIKYYNKALSILNNKQNTNSLTGTSAIFITDAYSGIGKAYLSEYKKTNNTRNLFNADTSFSNAINKFSEISFDINNSDKLVLINDFDYVYDLQINNLIALYNITNDIKYKERAFNYIEKSKASALLSSVNTENALKTSDLPDELFEYENNLKDKINGLRQLLEKEKYDKNTNQQKINFFEKELLVTLKKHDSLISYLETNFPKYYSLKYNNEIISLKEIQKNLKEDEVIIEYHNSDNKLAIAAISKTDFMINEVDIDINFNKSLDFILNIKEIDFNKENKSTFNEFKKHSYNLWKHLIFPVEEFISNKRLIIIPDEKLGYLPFDILIEYDFVYDGINYHDLPYLLHSHPISYSYSANLLYNTYFKHDIATSTINITAFSPDYNDTANNVGTEIYQELRYAKQEVETIINKYGGQSYSGTDATKENFKNIAPKSNILHLAMHATINDSLPMQSKMIFAGNRGNYMHTHEIFNMDLNTDMVVLSACNTGSGRLSTGEGIISMARGFVYAGAPSVVMTLWEAQDETGANIMESYYDYLNKGLTKDVALQQAKLNVLKDANMAKSHPFFWSSYIVSGETIPLQLTSSAHHNNVIFIILSVIIIYYISIFVNRKYITKKATE